MGYHTISKRLATWIALLCSLGSLGCSDDNNLTKSNPPSGHWETEYVRDGLYSDGRIFDLAYPGEIGPYDCVNVKVREEQPDYRDPDAKKTYMDIGPGFSDTYDASDVLTIEVTRDQWQLLYDQDTAHCPVALVFYNGRRYGIGVSMEITRYSSPGVPTGVIDTIGYTGPEGDTLRIVQPTPKDNFPTNPAWNLMWRNCYRIPWFDRSEDIDLKIFKGPIGSEGTVSCLNYQKVDNIVQASFIKILGLDQYNLQGEKIPDGKLDDRVDVFRPDQGLIIFPEREPFNSNRIFENANREQTDTLAVKVPILYNYSSITQRMDSSVYYLQVRYWVRDSAAN